MRHAQPLSSSPAPAQRGSSAVSCIVVAVPLVSHNSLEPFVVALLQAVGVRAADAGLVARHLVDASLCGHDSHGVRRVPQYVAAVRSGEVDVHAIPRVVHETTGCTIVDGARGFGQVSAARAVDIVVEKARAGGIAAATVRNCYHTGRIGSYTETIAAAGMAGIALVNAGGGGQSVAPFGGSDRRLATNPISIAVPGDTFPLVLDMATSVAPEGKIRALAQQGRPTPDGWLIDAQGRPTNDAAEFYHSPAGAILPLGGAAGHKGFGLALMVDVLAGALSGAGCCSADDVEARDGMLLIAVDVAQFGGLDRFRTHVGELIAHVKSSSLVPGFAEIIVPGELEHRRRNERLSGGIDIDAAAWNELVALGDELTVPTPEAPVGRKAVEGIAAAGDRECAI